MKRLRTSFNNGCIRGIAWSTEIKKKIKKIKLIFYITVFEWGKKNMKSSLPVWDVLLQTDAAGIIVIHRRRTKLWVCGSRLKNLILRDGCFRIRGGAFRVWDHFGSIQLHFESRLLCFRALRKDKRSRDLKVYVQVKWKNVGVIKNQKHKINPTFLYETHFNDQNQKWCCSEVNRD